VRIEVDPTQGDEAATLLAARLGADAVGREGGRLTLSGLTREGVPEVVRALATALVRVYRVEPREPTLEDVYFALQGESGATPVEVA
jgi:ABC-2 type transport system ATP-binding protein